MQPPLCQADPRTQFELHGFLRDYLDRITDQWLLVAPRANPAMLEMFGDREVAPLRELVPWAGEFAGKYLTAAVQILRLTRNRHLKSWLREFVDRMIAHQAQDGYLGPWPRDCRLTNFNPYLGDKGIRTWDTWGHYHVMLGLLLWHAYARDRRALRAATAIGDLICRKYLGAKTPRLVDTGCTEMNLAPVHALCLLYRKTRDPRHLAMARQIVDEFSAVGPDGPLAGDYLRQALAGKEFFETPKPRWESLHPIMGLAELYWLTGEDLYRRAFARLWWSMAAWDRHNNGGFTSGEKATGNPYDAGAIETCCTIAWIAMSVEMLKLTADPLVADELELATLNSVVGMHSASGRWATYNTPSDGLRRASAHQIVFQARSGSPELNCCSVNSPRGFGLIGDWAVMRDRDGILLNHYGPSRLTVPVGRGVAVTLEQRTDYPLSGEIRIAVTPSRPAAFALKLRIPQWSRATRVALNGRPVKGIRPGCYLKLVRRWRKGDRVALRLDMTPRYWPGERECAGRTSIYRGPLLLAFDHRYNLRLAAPANRHARDADPWKPFDTATLNIPVLDARKLRLAPVPWHDWLPPLLLVEVPAAGGRRVRLCDFGSAGEGGTPYVSWLPVRRAPRPVAFTPANPLRRRHRAGRGDGRMASGH